MFLYFDIFKSMSNNLILHESEKHLLKHIKPYKVPTYRQAYSDRTAWIMAKLSEVVYKPLGKKNLESLKGSLNAELGIIIEKTYDQNGTQALLASFAMSEKKYLVLSFRGTEKNSLQDIKADINISQAECKTGGKVHKGFSNAYEYVESEIKNDLNNSNFSNMPLFITGHSLGGALATIAAKRLTHKGGIAACYTFGSPRVGNQEWLYNMKAPNYRVVNALDCVTMLPPTIVMSIIARIVKRVPLLGSWVCKTLGYVHLGDLRYLTSCKKNQYDNVKLLPNISFYARIQIFFKHKRVSQFLRDHSISIYCKKLAIIAKNRNKKTL